MSALFKNNATALLAASISSSGTTLVLAAGTGVKFPVLVSPNFFYGTIYDSAGNYEIVKVTARTADSLTIVRAQEGTTALAFSSGDAFAQRVTAAALNDFAQKSVDQTFTGANTFSGNNTLSGTNSFTGANSFTNSPTAPTPTVGDNTTKLSTTAFVQNALAGATISGQIAMWPTTSAPSGWLICDGSAVSRTTYSTLFGIVGTTFGSGDGSTTFNLPNYQGRTPLGASGSYALASTGGSADAIVVSHTHTATSVVTDPGHNHTIPGNFATFGGGSSSGANNTFGIASATNSSTTGITVATTNASTGSSGTNANLPPYLSISFIIKV